ncbi:unnamed protein product [Caretta caretta]
MKRSVKRVSPSLAGKGGVLTSEKENGFPDATLSDIAGDTWSTRLFTVIAVQLCIVVKNIFSSFHLKREPVNQKTMNELWFHDSDLLDGCGKRWGEDGGTEARSRKDIWPKSLFSWAIPFLLHLSGLPPLHFHSHKSRGKVTGALLSQSPTPIKTIIWLMKSETLVYNYRRDSEVENVLAYHK